MKTLFFSLSLMIFFSISSFGQAKEYYEFILCENETGNKKVTVYINEEDIESFYESDLIKKECTAFYLYVNPETWPKLLEGKFLLYKEGKGIFSEGSTVTTEIGIETTLSMSKSQNLNEFKTDGFSITIKNLISSETLQCRYIHDK